MAETPKVLGQSNPIAATLTDVYTVPGATVAVVSTITVANRSSVDTTFRIAVSPAGAAISDEHYLYYDTTIPGNDTFATTIGISLEATDVIRVLGTLATLSFNVFGIERSP
jgi:hypothetical protein